MTHNRSLFSGNWSVDSKQDAASIVHRGAEGTVCVTVEDGVRVEVQSHTANISHMGNVYPGTSAVFSVNAKEMIVVSTVPAGKSAKGTFDFIPKA